MSNGSDTQLQSIDRATLTPLVRQALGSETVEVVDYHCQQILGGAGRTEGVYRLTGSGHDQGEVVRWSLILKIIPFMPERDDPSERAYWKREILAYQSGLLDDLPGGLAAPRCFDVVEQPGRRFWLWLEEVADEFRSADEIGSQWPLEHYGVVARHLGQFNGAYLLGRNIPSEPWLASGWLRSQFARASTVNGIAQLRDSMEHPLVRRVYPPHAADSVFRLWDEREAFLKALDGLPQTLCHFDAFRRNLFARRGADGGYRTVAIDWAFVRTGALGEEIVAPVSASLFFREVGQGAGAGADGV